MADGVRCWLPIPPEAPRGNLTAPAPSSLSSPSSSRRGDPRDALLAAAPLPHGESGLLENGNEAASSLGVSLRGGVSVRSSRPAAPASDPPNPAEALRLPPLSKPPTEGSPFSWASAFSVVQMRSGLEEESCLCCCSWLRPRTAAEGSSSCLEVLVVEPFAWVVESLFGEDWFALSPARSPLLPLPGLRWRVFTRRDRLGEVELLLGHAGMVICITEESILGMITSDLRMSGLETQKGFVNKCKPHKPDKYLWIHFSSNHERTRSCWLHPESSWLPHLIVNGKWKSQIPTLPFLNFQSLIDKVILHFLLGSQLLQKGGCESNLIPLSWRKLLGNISLLDELVHGVWGAALSGAVVLKQPWVLFIQRLLPPGIRCTTTVCRVLPIWINPFGGSSYLCNSFSLSSSCSMTALSSMYRLLALSSFLS